MRKWLLLLAAIAIGCTTESEDGAGISAGIYQGPDEFNESYKYRVQLIFRDDRSYEFQTSEFWEGLDSSYTDLTDFCRTLGHWTIKPDSLILIHEKSGCADLGGEKIFQEDIDAIVLQNRNPDSSRYSLGLRNVTDSSFQILNLKIAPLKWDAFSKI